MHLLHFRAAANGFELSRRFSTPNPQRVTRYSRKFDWWQAAPKIGALKGEETFPGPIVLHVAWSMGPCPFERLPGESETLPIGRSMIVLDFRHWQSHPIRRTVGVLPLRILNIGLDTVDDFLSGSDNEIARNSYQLAVRSSVVVFGR